MLRVLLGRKPLTTTAYSLQVFANEEKIASMARSYIVAKRFNAPQP